MANNKKASTKRQNKEQQEAEKVATAAAKVKQQAVKALHESLQAAIAPHEHGTVTQLSEQLQVSKSEIRRRKREGTLDELINSYNSTIEPTSEDAQ